MIDNLQEFFDAKKAWLQELETIVPEYGQPFVFDNTVWQTVKTFVTRLLKLIDLPVPVFSTGENEIIDIHWKGQFDLLLRFSSHPHVIFCGDNMQNEQRIKGSAKPEDLPLLLGVWILTVMNQSMQNPEIHVSSIF